MTDKNWKFVHVADMQPGSPRSYRFNPAWMENWKTARSQIIRLNPEFILIGGDVTRDGSIHPWELRLMKEDFDGMGIPYHVIPGNMDTGNKHARKQGARAGCDDVSLNITSGHLNNWKDVFGDWKWRFTRGNVRVTGICDMVINSGLPEEKELWEWLDEQKNILPVEHDIWLTHYPLFVERPDEPNWNISIPGEYLKWYFSIDLPGRQRLLEVMKETGASRVISGHVHCMHESFFGGLHFENAPATCGTQFTDKWPGGKNKVGFFAYHVREDTMEREFIPLDKISRRNDGYGPGGHPLPAERDYSAAWEK